MRMLNLLIACWCLLCTPLQAGVSTPLPAFPGAEGDGAFSQGGRGGKVLIVDRLDDPCPTQACTTEDLADPARLVPGTLRWALMQPFPRTVVFRVSGLIELLPDELHWNEQRGEVDITRLANIRITSPYLTVAGQTAPAGGITLKNNGITLLTHDVVLRYLTFRTGRQLPVFSGQQSPETLMIETDARDVIVDHCSLSWMPAEGVSVYTGEMWHGTGTAERLTLSWNLIGEGLVRHEDGRGHPNAAFMSGFDGDPQYAADRITLHHNLFVHTQKRNGDLLNKSGRLVNNLIYNWQWLPTVLGGGIQADVIGNVWKAGPQTSSYPPEKGGLHLVPSDLDTHETDPDGWWHAVPGTPSLFMQDNHYARSAAAAPQPLELPCYYRQREQGCQSVPLLWLRGKAQPGRPGEPWERISIQPAGVAEQTILRAGGNSQRIGAAGHWLPNRDPVDSRYVREYQAGSYLRESFPWHEDEVGGYPLMIDGQAYPDQDKDGMSDVWERQQGLNPADPADASQIGDGRGYTWLELFINGSRPVAAVLP